MKICVFTGTRAEYGLLLPLMNEINADPTLTLQLLVSGAHLSSEFGLTYKEIEKDGFKIDKKVKLPLHDNSPQGVTNAMGVGLIGYGEALSQLKPDIGVVLGDRYEAFSFAAAAMIHRTPIAHLHGGESTYGAIDEAIRHAITKMSHLHFTSTEPYRQRVIQLGEDPVRVFNMGAIGLDNINNMDLLSRKQLEQDLRLKWAKHNFLVTFHPVTLELESAVEQFHNLLSVLSERDDTLLIFTKANADVEGRRINQMIDDYVAKNPEKAVGFASLGTLRYLSLMQYVDAVVGNSSSGIIEAPSFERGSINIGDRQEGRIKASSVIDCEPTIVSLKQAFSKLFSPEFQASLKGVKNPYGQGGTATKIKHTLKTFPLADILKKRFYV